MTVNSHDNTESAVINYKSGHNLKQWEFKDVVVQNLPSDRKRRKVQHEPINTGHTFRLNSHYKILTRIQRETHAAYREKRMQS